MKKTTIWAIVAAAVIAIGGGVIYGTEKASSNKVDAAYEKAMNSGKEAVKDQDYVAARSDFAKANEVKQTKTAQIYEKQANNMQAAVNATKDGKYSTALQKVAAVTNEDNGYSVLNKQGQKLKTTVNEVQDNYQHEIKPLLADAKKAETDSKYSEAIKQYQSILDLPYINGKYYATYKQEAEDGIKADQKASQVNNDSTTNKQSTQANTNSSSTNKANEDTGNAGKTGEGSMGDHKVHGKTVTDDQITQLRKQVGSLGFDAMSWSPQDLIDMYRKSGRSNINQITKKDIQTYLKP
ncbi:hypothetical protein OZX56_00815 [Lactobacillus sp. ESL0684]|uniref:hypothetical protein n=1 Tax=Lactobacillus sp. ESL0684 TaxID=2983213 RepID=UPI0023F65B2C|nr:hypothetical protein [Lactobacillus sp. ESL0684]WEV43811.1 hypothetical protein OZX56_00815 [Lactobacillus sp. ESL0684]